MDSESAEKASHVEEAATPTADGATSTDDGAQSVTEPPPPPYVQPAEQAAQPPMPREPSILRVGLVGEAKSGISAMMERFQHDTFPVAPEDAPVGSWLWGTSTPATATITNTSDATASDVADTEEDGGPDATEPIATTTTTTTTTTPTSNAPVRVVEYSGALYSVQTRKITELDSPSTPVGGSTDSLNADSMQFVEVSLPSTTTALDCIVVTYAINARGGFESATALCDTLSGQGVPYVLAATKADLDNERVVSQVEGEELAAMHSIPFLETSALTDSNVHELFANVIVPLADAVASAEVPRKAPRVRACTFPPTLFATADDLTAAEDSDTTTVTDPTTTTHNTVDTTTTTTTTISGGVAGGEVAEATTTATYDAAGYVVGTSIEAATAPTVLENIAPNAIKHLEEDAANFLRDLQANAADLQAADPAVVGAETAAALTTGVMDELRAITFDPAAIKLAPADLHTKVKGEHTRRKVRDVAAAAKAKSETSVEGSNHRIVAAVYCDAVDGMLAAMDPKDATIDGTSVAEFVAPECEMIAKMVDEYNVQDEEPSSTEKQSEVSDAKTAIAEMESLAPEGASRQNKMKARKMSAAVKKALEQALAVNAAQMDVVNGNLTRTEVALVQIKSDGESAQDRVVAATKHVAEEQDRIDADREAVAQAVAAIETKHIADRAALFESEQVFKQNDRQSAELLLGLSVGLGASAGAGTSSLVGGGGVQAVFAKAMARAVRQTKEANALVKKQAVHDTRSGSIMAHSAKVASYRADLDTYAAQCAATTTVVAHLGAGWKETVQVLEAFYTARKVRYTERKATLKRERYDLCTLWVPNFVQEFTVPVRKKLVQQEIEHKNQTVLLDRFVEFTDPDEADTDETAYTQSESNLTALAGQIDVTKARISELEAIRISFLVRYDYVELAAELKEVDVTDAEDQVADAELQRMRRVLDPKWSAPMALPGAN